MLTQTLPPCKVRQIQTTDTFDRNHFLFRNRLIAENAATVKISICSTSRVILFAIDRKSAPNSKDYGLVRGV